MTQEYKFDAILNLNDPDFISKFKLAVGLKDGEKMEIMTPQFNRTDGLQVPFPQFNFLELPHLPEDTLKAIGCQKWNEPDTNGETLWLYPTEWYDHIPNQIPIWSISGKKSLFDRGKTDNDRRFGALAFGFKRKDGLP